MRLRVAMLCLLAAMAGNVGASSPFAELTVEILKKVGNYAAGPGGKFHAVRIHSTNPAIDLSNRGELLEVQDVPVRSDPKFDLFAELEKWYKQVPFQCVIIDDDVPWQYVIVAEQFARPRKDRRGLVVVAHRPDLSTAPFLIVGDDNTGYFRLAAASAYGLHIPPAPTFTFRQIDSDRGIEGWIGCAENASWRQPNINEARAHLCNSRGYKILKKPERFAEGMRDLSRALALIPDDKFQDPAYKKAWGVEYYNPHANLASYMVAYGNCPAANRELQDSKLSRDDIRNVIKNCNDLKTPHIEYVGFPPVVTGAGGGESELLPPFAPAFDWNGIFALR